MYDATVYLHHSQADAQVVHLLDGGLPIFDLHWVLSVGEYDNLTRPCLLVTKESVLGLDGDNESIDSYRRQLD